MFDLPDKLVGTRIRFNKNSVNDCNEVTYTDLRKGLPKAIFIKCKVDTGDLYSFSPKSAYRSPVVRALIS